MLTTISGTVGGQLRQVSLYKQNFINHLERKDNTRLPKHALSCKPRGRKARGRPRKRWQRVDAGTGQATYSVEEDDDDDDDDDDILGVLVFTDDGYKK